MKLLNEKTRDPLQKKFLSTLRRSKHVVSKSSLHTEGRKLKCGVRFLIEKGEGGSGEGFFDTSGKVEKAEKAAGSMDHSYRKITYPCLTRPLKF